MAERAGHESDWVSAHIFYRDDLDRLLTRVVAPLVAELRTAGRAEEFFFLRYWDGGPHLRLRILPAQGTGRAGAEQVERLIRGRFEDYLASHPSADRGSEEEYERQARTLAQREGVPYAARRLPNNSVILVPYRREHHRYGHGPAMWAVERHFAESSRIALRVLTLETSPAQRATAAAAVLMLTWLIESPPPRPGSGRVAPVGAPVPLLALARQMRALTGRAATSPARGTLIDWARSMVALRSALPAPDAAGVLDICAHLLCNRFGVSIAAERTLRGLAADALAELATEGT